MRIFLLLFLFLGIYFSVNSQDFIKKNNGDTVWCKISEIHPYYLQYRSDSLIHTLSTDSITGYKLEFFDYVQIDKEQFIKKYNNGKMPKKYFLAISPGIGENHGIGGLKVLLGPNGTSGIFGCVGYGDMSVFWKCGIQANIKGFYCAGSVGTMEFYEVGDFVYETHKINGLTIEIGAIINLNKNKRFFIQMGLGYNIPFDKIDPLSYYYSPITVVSFTGLIPEFGIGVKF